jgi:lysophospholipase L1-like esterase
MKKIIFLLLILISGAAYSQSCPTMHSKVDSLVACKFRLKGFSTGLLKIGTNGVGGLAVPGTDYAPATSGTSILKGNGSGGFSSAVAGTDYPAINNTTLTGTTTIDSLQLSKLNVGGTDTIRYGSNIYIFGTSITLGAYPGISNYTGTGYTYANLFTNRNGANVYNYGVASSSMIGCSSISMVNRLSEVPTYTASSNTYLMFEYGVNDAGNQCTTYDSTTFKTAYYKVIDTAIARGWPSAKILLYVTYTNTVKSKLVYKTVKTIANTKSCTYINVYEDMVSSGGYLLINSDSVHPNKNGHAVIVNSIMAGIGQTHKKSSLINNSLNVTGSLNIGSGVISGGYSYFSTGLKVVSPIELLMGSTLRGIATFKRSTYFDSSLYIGEQSVISAVTRPARLSLSAKYNSSPGVNIKISLVGNNDVYGFSMSPGSTDYFSGGDHTFYTSSIAKIGTLSSTGNWTVPGSVILGTTTVGGVTSPKFINLGNDFSSTAATNLKIRIFNNTMGFTASPSSMDYVVPTSTDHSFYGGTSKIARITSTGKMFMGGSTTPTALVHIAAGTATANTAPLKFTSGTNLTTPEAGAVEFDGTNYFATASTTRYTIAKTLTNTATLDFGSTAVGAATDLTVTVTGAASGDVCMVGAPNGSVPNNGAFSCWVSAADTVTVRFINPDQTNAKDPSSGTFRVSVIKY